MNTRYEILPDIYIGHRETVNDKIANQICRTEFIIVEGVPHLLEINTVPGLTSASIVPQQVSAAGIKMSDFFDSLLAEAMKNH